MNASLSESLDESKKDKDCSPTDKDGSMFWKRPAKKMTLNDDDDDSPSGDNKFNWD